MAQHATAASLSADDHAGCNKCWVIDTPAESGLTFAQSFNCNAAKSQSAARPFRLIGRSRPKAAVHPIDQCCSGAWSFLTSINSAAFLAEHQFSGQTINGYHGACMSACFLSVGFSSPHYSGIYIKMICFVSVNPDGAHGQVCVVVPSEGNNGDTAHI